MKKNEIKMSAPALTDLMKDERGMSTVEYVILLAVIVMGAVGAWTRIGDDVKANLGGAEEDINALPLSQ
jgi:Flp pilus assembly pilin Flp